MMPARCSEVRPKKNMKSPVVPGLSSSSVQGGEKLSRCQADSRYCQQEEMKIKKNALTFVLAAYVS